METIVAGFIRSSHGIKGEFKVQSASGETEHFFKLKEVTLSKEGKISKRFQVEHVRGSLKTLIMKLKGIDTPEDAKRYSSWSIVIDRDEAAPKGPEEFYSADLEGCTVFFEGKSVGLVKALLEGGAGDLLEIEKEDKQIVYIPFQHQFIKDVNVDNKKIDLKVDWILE